MADAYKPTDDDPESFLAKYTNIDTVEIRHDPVHNFLVTVDDYYKWHLGEVSLNQMTLSDCTKLTLTGVTTVVIVNNEFAKIT